MPPFAIRLLYGCTIFLSSFLLFLIQPIFAKLILPWFGGSAAVWTTCLVFFQVALLLGYLYAHLLPRRGILIHIVLLGCALLLLPTIPGRSWIPAPNQNPAWHILALLTVVLGLPYFLLSSTSPLLQSWFASRWPGAQTYRLFALSNLGALLALAAYPVLIEPYFPTRAQDIAWSMAFVVFVVLCATAGVMSKNRLWGGPLGPRDRVYPLRALVGPSQKPAGGLAADQGVRPTSFVTWVALAAAGSMLLLATTNQLTQNVAAVPFLWILPLLIYLLTFVLCFGSSRWYRRGIALRLLAIALGSVAYAIFDIQVADAMVVSIPIFTIGLFLMCMYCHGELSLRRPEEKYLTSFYLMIALGGALGAICVGLVAPVIFSGIYELPISLLVVAAIALRLTWRSGWSQRLLWSVATIAMMAVVGWQVRAYHLNTVSLMRNFYGVLRVVDSEDVRTLYHGTIKHGSQYLTPRLRMLPTTYYGPPSGAGLALRYGVAGAKRVGVIGLGAGTLSAYGQPGDRFHFYEINPQVIELARSQFFYLRETPASVEITTGDARLSLESEPAQNFDVLVVDAFSGDAIPVHLLTKEVLAVYFRHLKPAGILAFHVSNQFLDLAPVVRQLASSYDCPAVLIRSGKDEQQMLSAASWVLVTRNHDFLARGEITNVAEPIPPRPGLRLWTDDYNNLLQVIR